MNKEEDNNSKQDETCNCRDQATCPVENNCLKNKATVQYEDKEQHYIGMTEKQFQDKIFTCTNPPSNTARNENRQSCLISYGHLKTVTLEYKLTWSIIDRARPYQAGKRTCNLCLSEKFHILTGSHLINRKTELLSKCPHRRKYLACNVKA